MATTQQEVQMDSIGGMNVMNYREKDIRAALNNRPALLNDKKFMELFAGYIVACMLYEETGQNLMVGFPLKTITKHTQPISGPSLQELIDDTSIIDDSDVDICISNKQNLYRCQITRVVPPGDRNWPTRDFLDVLKKKLRVQSDDKLTLIINIEDSISINEDQLNDFLSKNEIPYGAIFVVGKSANNTGIFRCWRIHPDISASEEFDIRVPL